MLVMFLPRTKTREDGLVQKAESEAALPDLEEAGDTPGPWKGDLITSTSTYRRNGSTVHASRNEPLKTL